MNYYLEKIVKVKHQGREIHGIYYIPKVEEKFPVVIFSHGFNGSHNEFKMNCEFLASRDMPMG